MHTLTAAIVLLFVVGACSAQRKMKKNEPLVAQKVELSDTTWKVRNQVTEFMIKFFKYGLLADVSTSNVSLVQVNKYKELFYENAKLYNDLENKPELISIHQYFAILIDYTIDKKYEVYFKENITNDFINNDLNGILQKLKTEPDGSFKIKVPVEKWTNHYFDATTKKLEKYPLPLKNQLKITLYANPESDETSILTVEK